jgi:hypothetical protein
MGYGLDDRGDSLEEGRYEYEGDIIDDPPDDEDECPDD